MISESESLIIIHNATRPTTQKGPAGQNHCHESGAGHWQALGLFLRASRTIIDSSLILVVHVSPVVYAS